MRPPSNLSATTLIAVASLAQAQNCVENGPTGDAITGFRFSGTCESWQWFSRDKGTQVKLQPDCFLRQTFPNATPVGHVCIQLESGGHKCFSAPGAGAPQCRVPDDFCSGIQNMWGW
ncbi:hypothetical protein CPAR01_06421 [Colletotrichum paranaense]|uniref:Uncharacterized protein n=1 Tax=Colletotrichum paranaense TaxID=1914294 RepID=A0ABQ9SLM8_9PEZI|nr:uncharacterized protein CPAR01_06421 [Colletotrichum paranaense]KAK1540432.1 hypothetical protein CPAR01_06421 [Colletotrichum paranaense]